MKWQRKSTNVVDKTDPPEFTKRRRFEEAEFGQLSKAIKSGTDKPGAFQRWADLKGEYEKEKAAKKFKARRRMDTTYEDPPLMERGQLGDLAQRSVSGAKKTFPAYNKGGMVGGCREYGKK